MAAQTPLVVIVGPTASGKSELALKVAQKCNGEIICADSRTVYKGMDLGTAKPSKKDQRRIKHHVLDVVEPGQRFTAHTFKKCATEAIHDIRAKGKLPLLVGGTGLYIDSVIFDYVFPAVRDISLKERLNTLDMKELYDYCKNNSIDLPINIKNKRHILSAIVRSGQTPQRKPIPLPNTIIMGISVTKETLEQRITTRTEHLFSHGVVEEAKKLGEIYGWDSEAMSANIYPLLHQYLKGELSLAATKERFIILDRQLAKRQMTWLKRNKFITWRSLDEAEHFLFASLAKVE